MLAHEVPLPVPLVVFIQVGGVQGLAHMRMLPLIACAAFTYGIRHRHVPADREVVSAVSPDVSS